MAGVTVTPQQVYQEVLSLGGSTTQAEVAAALVDGIESDGNTLELSGGKGPAQGLFQFEPGTWTGSAGGGKDGLPSTVAAANWQQQVVGFVNATGGPGGSDFQAWGPDLSANPGDPNSASNPDYSYTGAPQPGSKVANAIANLGLPAGGGTAASGGSTAAAASTATGAYSDITIPGVGTEQLQTAQQADAWDTLSANLSAYGFTPQQLDGPTGLLAWAWGEITSNADPSQVAIDLQSQPAFLQQFPGFAKANQELINSGNAAMSVAQYQSYQTSAEQLAQAGGLPPGFLNKDNIGFLAGQNISINELTARINDATTLAIQSTPEQQQMFNQYFGVQDSNGYLGINLNGQGGLTTGQIAALALDPMTAEPLIKQQITAAQIGGSFDTAGLSGVDASTATQLAQAGIDSSTGLKAAQGLGIYAPLTAARPGMGAEAAQGVVSSDQLALGNLLGNVGAQRQEQTAIEVAGAPFHGGGGYVSNTKGSAVGSASSSGSGQ